LVKGKGDIFSSVISSQESIREIPVRDMNETQFGENKKAGAIDIKILAMGESNKFTSPEK
jgi:hypothetical protein